MKIQKITTTSQSTIYTKNIDNPSSNYISDQCSVQQNIYFRRKRSPQTTMSMMKGDFVRNYHVEKKVMQTERLKTGFVRVTQFGKTQCEGKNSVMAMRLQKLVTKKKRYCFQILKQFILFPDQSQSSVTSVSKYDPLIFQDQTIHSLVKILQTKSIQNIIWGFINLRMMPYLNATIKIEKKVNETIQRTLRIHKRESFDMIKKVPEEVFYRVGFQDKCTQVTKHVSYQQKQVLQLTSQKKARKSCLTIRTIQEQVIPVTKNKHQTPPIYGGIRIYSREEYNQKHANKISPTNNDNYTPTVVRISASEYSNQQPHRQKSQNIFQTKSTSTGYQEIKQNKINKYNIIHYHQKQREIVQVVKVNQVVMNRCLGCSCLSCSNCCCSNNCCCLNPQCSWSKQNCSHQAKCYFCSNSSEKCDRLNETSMTRFTQKQSGHKTFKNQLQTSNQQLSQLQSRIEYLNFLKKVVKQQQEQQIS